MNFRALLQPILAASAVVAALFAAPQAFAAVGESCTPDVYDAQGNLTTDNFTEVCDGANVLICSSETSLQVAINCAALFQDAPVGTCQVFPSGPSCAFADGDACVFSGGPTNPVIPFPCQNPTSGCVEGLCTANVEGCDLESPNNVVCESETSIQLGCLGDGQKFILSCNGLVVAYDGTSGPLTCSGAGEDLRCNGALEGDNCATGLVECPAGLTCEGEGNASLGTCAAAGEGEGEGEGEGDDGRDDPPPEAPRSLFSCQSSDVSGLSFFAALTLLVGFRRRRA